MKALFALGGIVPAALVLAAGLAAGSRPIADDKWRGDWEKARVEARGAGKPLFVVFR